MIQIYKEPENLGFPYEDCVFCKKGTQFWAIDEDVPVCQGCAECRQDWHLPFKEEWALARGRQTRNSIQKSNQTPTL